MRAIGLVNYAARRLGRAYDGDCRDGAVIQAMIDTKEFQVEETSHA